MRKAQPTVSNYNLSFFQNQLNIGVSTSSPRSSISPNCCKCSKYVNLIVTSHSNKQNCVHLRLIREILLFDIFYNGLILY